MQKAVEASAVLDRFLFVSDSFGDKNKNRTEICMKINSDTVYIARTPIDRAEAPFETYRELAYRTLAALEVELPAEGTVLLKPNATVLYPVSYTHLTLPTIYSV